MNLSIRKYKLGEELALRNIFYTTIRNVNIKDYSESQVRAWAPKEYDKTAWIGRIRSINPNLVILDGTIVGYADIQDDGLVEHFYCHYEHQGKGIGRALMQTLIEACLKNGRKRMYSNVSITAKPFFEHFAFKALKKQSVTIRGQLLTNYLMEKIL